MRLTQYINEASRKIYKVKFDFIEQEEYEILYKRGKLKGYDTYRSAGKNQYEFKSSAGLVRSLSTEFKNNEAGGLPKHGYVIAHPDGTFSADLKY